MISEISTSVFFDTLDPSGPRYCFEYQPTFEGVFNGIANRFDKEMCNIW